MGREGKGMRKGEGRGMGSIPANKIYDYTPVLVVVKLPSLPNITQLDR